VARKSGLHINTQSNSPIFRQISEQIADRIRSGVYPEGYQLPPSRRLAEEVGTHRNTIVRAYEDLAAAQWVTSGVGRGTFVSRRGKSPAAPSTPLPQGGLPWTTLLSRVGAAESLGRVDRLPRSLHNDLINLTRMQPSADLLPADELRRCVDHVLRVHGPRALGYAPREGLPQLRELIAQDLARSGVPADPEHIIVTTGSQQALDAVARCLVNPGDAVAVEAETYTGAINIMTAAGARLVSVPGDDEGPDMSALERVSEAKCLYLMPNSRNPTGNSISEARRRALVAWSRRANVALIEDDYGADLELDEITAPPALRALDADVIYVSTFSKRLIPALRVGFVVCPPELGRYLLNLKHMLDLGTSALLQHALAEFLDRGYLQTHLSRSLPEYRRRRDALEEALSRWMPAEVRWSHVKRGVVQWLRLPPQLRADEVFAEAQRAGVLVSPGALHSVSGGAQSGLRLTFCFEPRERLVEGVKRLATVIRESLARGPSSRPSNANYFEA